MSENTDIKFGVCDECSTIRDEDELVALFYDDGSEIKLCKKCYALEFGTSKAPEKQRTDAVDIHKIIDDAMEKGDRSVYILIHSGGMSVTINPYVEEKVQWIEGRDRLWLTCSNCGRPLKEREWTPFCPHCGEQMHGVRREKTDKNP